MNYPVTLSMSGFYIIIVHNRSDSSATCWKVQASNNGNTFIDITTPNAFIYDDLVLNKYTFPPSGNYTHWRFHIMLSSTNFDVEAGVALLQWIPTFTCSQTRKCHVGYVPRLMYDTSFCGFDLKVSSEYTNNKAFNACKGEGHVLLIADRVSNADKNLKSRIEV